MAALKTRTEYFTEAMDEIMGLFYKESSTKHYCCEPGQINDILTLVDELVKNGCNKLQIRRTAIPAKDRENCTEPDRLPSLQHSLAAMEEDREKLSVLEDDSEHLSPLYYDETRFFPVTLGTKDLFIGIILCYYITSRISGGYDFDIHTVLRRLIPGNTALDVVRRTSISEMIMKVILFREDTNPICNEIIEKFKQNLVTLSDLSVDALDRWAAFDPASADSADKVQTISRLQSDIIRNYLGRKKGGKSKKRNIKKHKSKKHRKV
jgi:hypothetical protein